MALCLPGDHESGFANSIRSFVETGVPYSRGTPALYTSHSPMTAIREAQPLGRPIQPLALCAYEVDGEPAVDTLDEDQCRAPGADESDLVCPTWEAEMLAGAVPASQALADCLIASGYAGMRVQSFAAGRVAEMSTLCCEGGVHAARTASFSSMMKGGLSGGTIPCRVESWRGDHRDGELLFAGGFRHVPVPQSIPWPRFQLPPHRTQHADFPHYALLFVSCQGLWDLSSRERFQP